MTSFAKKIPIPTAGLSLAFATFGDLIRSFTGDVIYWFCCAIALFLLALVAVKFIFDFNGVKKDYQNIVLIPLFTLIPMAIIVINSYFVVYSLSITTIIWYIALIMFIFNSIYCVFRFLKSKHFHKIYPSLFITILGINVPVFTQPSSIGQTMMGAILYTTAVVYVILLILITILLLKHKNIDKGTKPLLAIYAAPSSIIFVYYYVYIGQLYLNSFVLITLGVINIILFLFLTFVFTKSAFRGFVPSLAAFAFTVVINTFATKLLLEAYPSVLLNLYFGFEMIVCIIILFYVLGEYLKHLFWIGAVKKNFK